MTGVVKIINPTCGSTAHRAALWFLIFAWAANGKDRNNSSANLTAYCRPGDPGKRSLLAGVQTDGYSAYDRIGGPKMVHAACLAHARRKYVEAVKVDARDQDSARIVALMDKLFAIDAQARDEAINHAGRHRLRQEHAPALLAELRTQILSAQKRVLPKSAAGKAATYTLSLWKKLTLFLEYPELELSNNLAENSMRPVAIGRKNWIHLGSQEAGPKIAAIFSIVESCRRLGLPIRAYLAAVLPGLANRSIQTLHQITPTAYAKTKAS
jgi:hypothetical protein